MKKIYSLFVLVLLTAGELNAGIGDTIHVQVHNNVHMNWYGSYKQWGVFPPDTISFSKILLDYKLSCPSVGCSPWDYTTKIEANVKTGEIDSTLTIAPSFTVNGSVDSTLYFNNDTVWITFFDTTSMSTDSIPASVLTVIVFGDSLQPLIPTDTLLVWNGNFYNYLYDNSGNIIDSSYVGYDSLWTASFINVYTPFEVIMPIELARVITPYAGNFPLSWNFPYHFDVTDYEPILHDSLEINAFYSGYTDGFAVTLDFYFIEGTPPRDVHSVENIYHGSYQYGSAGNPIENHLVPLDFPTDTTDTQLSMRMIISGHGADNNNCAEFCSKNYMVNINSLLHSTVQIWRTDCGKNPLFPQPGTWIYNRGNWCPGAKVRSRDFDFTGYYNPGDTVNLNVDLSNYSGSGSAVYIIDAQLFRYGSPNHSLDATVEEIFSPNKDGNYFRDNPVCNKPSILIRNLGSTAITTLDITYGLETGTMSTYTWIGFLNFMDTATVVLPAMTWGGTASDVFKVYVSNPNSGNDQNIYNDTLRSKLNFTPQYPVSFVVVLRTNNAANETTWKMYDASGSIVYQRLTPLTANTIYRDTVMLASGCYKFVATDVGNDGLSFFANNDGTGYCRFQDAYGTAAIIKSFTADFGSFISQEFTIGYMTGAEEISSEMIFNVFPNPAGESVVIDLAGIIDKPSISLWSVTGQLMIEKTFDDFNGKEIQMDISEIPAGIYIVKAESDSYSAFRRLVISR